MKNKNKLGLIILIALTAFAVTVCDNGTGSGGGGGGGGGSTHSHSWGNWSITTFPTSITPLNGVETRTCTSCSETENRALTEANFKPYFYGNWKNTEGDLNDPPWSLSVGNNTLKISLGSLDILIENFPDNPIRTFTDLTWELKANPSNQTSGNNNTNAEFPFGFRLDGTKVGTIDPMFVSLGQNGKLLVNLNAGSTTGRQFLFEKE